MVKVAFTDKDCLSHMKIHMPKQHCGAPKTRGNFEGKMKVSSKADQWWKRVAILLALLGPAGLVWSTNVWLDQKRLPRNANPAAGRIYPVNVANLIVYQTRWERNWLIGVEYLPFVMFGVSVSIALMLFIQRKRSGRRIRS